MKSCFKSETYFFLLRGAETSKLVEKRGSRKFQRLSFYFNFAETLSKPAFESAADRVSPCASDNL